MMFSFGTRTTQETEGGGRKVLVVEDHPWKPAINASLALKAVRIDLLTYDLTPLRVQCQLSIPPSTQLLINQSPAHSTLASLESFAHLASIVLTSTSPDHYYSLKSTCSTHCGSTSSMPQSPPPALLRPETNAPMTESEQPAARKPMGTS